MFTQDAQDTCKLAFQAVEVLVQKVVIDVTEKEGSHDGSHALFAAISCIGGGLKVLAELISADKNGNKETALAAALITARIMIPSKDGVALDFTPRNVIAGIEAAGQVAGFDIKPYLVPRLVQTYQGFVTERGQSTGYWDDLKDVGPDFGDLAEGLRSVTRH